jgi:hypothetical protein
VSGTGRKRGRADADEALALTLATGQSQEQAARAAGVAARTVARRLADPAFRARVSEVRKDLFDRACGILCGGVGLAAAKLRTLMQETKSEMVLLAAARSVIDYALRLREHGSLEERLAQLEARAAAEDAKKATDRGGGK